MAEKSELDQIFMEDPLTDQVLGELKKAGERGEYIKASEIADILECPRSDVSRTVSALILCKTGVYKFYNGYMLSEFASSRDDVRHHMMQSRVRHNQDISNLATATHAYARCKSGLRYLPMRQYFQSVFNKKTFKLNNDNLGRMDLMMSTLTPEDDIRRKPYTKMRFKRK